MITKTDKTILKNKIPDYYNKTSVKQKAQDKEGDKEWIQDIKS